MFKRDKIFYSACGLTLIGIVLAVMGKELGLLFFVGAYLLRPSLHEFGLGRQYVDERQLMIHSRSGNISFIVTMLALVGYALLRAAQGKTGEELYEIIFIGLSARALTGLAMVGEYRKAGVMIISAVGLFSAIFIGLEVGFSTGLLVAAGVGILIIGTGQIARFVPRLVAVLLSILVLLVILFYGLYEFRRINTALWLFFVVPIATASICLFLGSGKTQEAVSGKVRSIAFGSLGAGVALVFALLIIFGGKEEPGGDARVLTQGETKEIQGIICEGMVTYYKDGKLETCILARDDTLSGNLIPAGSGIALDRNGIISRCSLPRDTYIQGHFCKGEGPTSWHTCFYPDGKLSLIWLAKDEVIQGIPCKEASFMSDVFGGGAGVSFHQNGKLKRCKLSGGVTIGGKSYEKGEHLNFDSTGTLRSQNG